MRKTSAMREANTNVSNLSQLSVHARPACSKQTTNYVRVVSRHQETQISKKVNNKNLFGKTTARSVGTKACFRVSLSESQGNLYLFADVTYIKVQIFFLCLQKSF